MSHYCISLKNTSTSHHAAIYVPATNMPLKCYIHATYKNSLDIDMRQVCQYMPHMNISTIYPGTLVSEHFTLYAFVPQLKCMLYWPCMLHYTARVVYI